MRRYRRHLVALAWIAALCGLPADASGQTNPAVSQTAQHLLRQLQAVTTLEGFLDELRREFTVLDADGDGKLSRADIELQRSVANALSRSGAFARIFRFDLDGDGVVTADEVRRVVRHERRLVQPSTPAMRPGEPPEDPVEAQVRAEMRPDVDGDGRITFAEALMSTQQVPLRGDPHITNIESRIAFYDLDGDGIVTLPEMETAAGKLFAIVDADGDGKLSREELAAHRQRLNEPARRRAEEAALKRQEERRLAEAERQRKAQEAREACAMPQASEAAKVILLGANRTEALSTVALVSQDHVTHSATVVVEPGTQPLYVVIASYERNIWRFSGAVERIERVVVNQVAGISGLASDRVTFLRRAECLPSFDEVPSIEAAKATGAITREAGKTPEIIVGRRTVLGFAVPSGLIQTTEEPGKPGVLVIHKSAGTLVIEGDASGIVVRKPDERSLEVDLKDAAPGGIAEIDASSVVAGVPAVRYDVLPRAAGLLQLVRSGALSRNRRGEYLIHKKMRFPTGLHGGHAVKFLLMKGVPEPDGDPRHSDLVSAETGLSLKKPNQ
jgi:Ca2+-binding EF-hand superfamily protein